MLKLFGISEEINKSKNSIYDIRIQHLRVLRSDLSYGNIASVPSLSTY